MNDATDECSESKTFLTSSFIVRIIIAQNGPGSRLYGFQSLGRISIVSDSGSAGRGICRWRGWPNSSRRIGVVRRSWAAGGSLFSSAPGSGRTAARRVRLRRPPRRSRATTTRRRAGALPRPQPGRRRRRAAWAGPSRRRCSRGMVGAGPASSAQYGIRAGRRPARPSHRRRGESADSVRRHRSKGGEVADVHLGGRLGCGSVLAPGPGEALRSSSSWMMIGGMSAATAGGSFSAESGSTGTAGGSDGSSTGTGSGGITGSASAAAARAPPGRRRRRRGPLAERRIGILPDVGRDPEGAAHHRRPAARQHQMTLRMIVLCSGREGMVSRRPASATRWIKGRRNRQALFHCSVRRGL